MTDETHHARAELDQHGAGWNERLDEMIANAQRDLLPLDADGEGAAVADLAQHMYDACVGHPADVMAKTLATYAATAILRLARLPGQ